MSAAHASASDRAAADIDAGGKGRQIRVAEKDIAAIGRNALGGQELACGHVTADIDVLGHADIALEN